MTNSESRTATTPLEPYDSALWTGRKPPREIYAFTIHLEWQTGAVGVPAHDATPQTVA